MKKYSIYMLGLLAAANFVNYMDRMVLSVMLPSIKADLDLSDGQLGWLTGMSFALFYGLLGLPIARLADTWIRKHVLSISLLAWSAMTMLSGSASNFLQMLVFRIGVGAGEAGCIPTSHSLIADLTPPEKRAGAFAVFTAGATLGLMFGLAFGGWLSTQVGWRWTFVLFGTPGLLLAALVVFTLKEPERGQMDGASVTAKVSTSESIRGLLSRRSYLHLLIGFSVTNFVSFGFMQWMPTYYIRTFDLSMTTIGLLMGFGVGAGMSIGVIAGGWIANHLLSKDMRWGIWIALGSMLVTIPLSLALVNTGDYRLAFLAQFLSASVGGIATGPLIATYQAVARSRERAMASAMIGFSASLIGLGGGPLVVGYLSDYFAGQGYENSIRAALTVAAFFSLWPVLHFYLAGRTLESDVASVRESDTILANPGRSGG